MMRAHALGVAADDLRQPVIVAREVGRLGEQLPRVAHGADRVADLVRDARAQAPERRELRLLHLLGDEARVLEEDQHRSGAARAKRRKVRPDDPCPVGGTRRSDPRPAASRSRRCSGARTQGETAAAVRPRPRSASGYAFWSPEHLRGRLVDEPDAVLGIDDQDALAQVLHDVLRELREVGEIELLAAHQRIALAQPAGDRPGGERRSGTAPRRECPP